MPGNRVLFPGSCAIGGSRATQPSKQAAADEFRGCKLKALGDTPAVIVVDAPISLKFDNCDIEGGNTGIIAHPDANLSLKNSRIKRTKTAIKRKRESR